MPVDVLAEFATLQQVMMELARQEFMARNPKRKRVFRGFVEAARLDLSATEANCFTATLTREVETSPLGFDLSAGDVFFTARDRLMSALGGAGSQGSPAAVDVPVLKLLARLGDRLGDGEWMDLRKQRDSAATRVDQESRARLSARLHTPLEQFADLDGEVVDFADAKGTFILRVKGHGSISVSFDRPDREDILDALKQRPALRVQVRGLVQWTTSKMSRVEQIDVVEHERKPDIDKLWDRIGSLMGMADGWLEGEGLAPTLHALTQAKDVLARLLADHADIPRPKVFPTPDGGAQAEWVLGRVAAEVRFPPEPGPIEADATHADCEASSERTFVADTLTCDDAAALAEWLRHVRTLEGGNDVFEARA